MIELVRGIKMELKNYLKTSLTDNIKNNMLNKVLPFIISSSVSFYSVTPKNHYNSYDESHINRMKNNMSTLFVNNNNNNNYIFIGDINIANSKKFVTNDNSDLEEIISEYNSNKLFDIINHYVYANKGTYHDNMHYKIIRKLSAEQELSKYNLKSPNVLIIDKTFQKAMIFTRTTIFDSTTAQSLNSELSDSMVVDNSLSKNINDIKKSIQYTKNNKYTYILTYEMNCSTAKIYGKKKRNGDGKTPEGLFFISSIAPSHNNTFDGQKAYGPYFMRIFNSIGIHGNGTDTVKVKNWKSDRAYMKPDPLGVNRQNFGYGVSHGCIRLDNALVRDYVEKGIFIEGMPVIIYEDSRMTKMLDYAYNNYNPELSLSPYY